jgi:hypothetical protein
VRQRFVGMGILLLLLTSACAKSADQVTPSPAGGKYGSGVDVGGLDAKGNPVATDGAHSIGGAAEEGPRYATPPPYNGGGAQSGSGARIPVRSYDRSALGMNAGVYLRPQAKRIAIEVNAVKGKLPRQASLNLLAARVKEVAKKPVTLLPTKTIEPLSSNSYTIEDIRKAEAENRKNYSNEYGDPVVMHILYLNGSFEGSVAVVADPLGIAYGASSVVIFPDEINRVAAAHPPGTIESAVLIHEVGHILSLVNIGYKSPRPHEDPSSKGHSKNTRSVMYAAVERIDVAAVFEDEVIPTTYDADDLADLADIRAGKIRPHGY